MSIEAKMMTPDFCAGKDAAEIAAMPVYMDGQVLPLGTFFTVSGRGGATPKETKLVINGDLRNIRYIGERMSAGEIVINGNASMYTGARMEGGSIVVNGNIDSFAAIDMKGGHLVVNGNAQDYLGAAYRGDLRGMSGGVITVHGTVGNDTTSSTSRDLGTVKRKIDRHAVTKLTEAQKVELFETFQDKESLSLEKMEHFIREHFGIAMKKMQVSRLFYEIQRG